MHCVIVGPGALGGLLTTFLTRGKQHNHKLTVLDHKPERAIHLNQNGITCFDQNGEETVTVTAASDVTQLGKVDVLLLCVKSYDLKDCIEFCRPVLQADTLVLFFQNGIGHLGMGDLCTPATVAFGTTTEGATLLGAGKVRHAGKGITALGFLEPQAEAMEQKLEAISDWFSAGGCEIQKTSSIRNRLWAKLFINVGINALTAIENCKNGELLNRADLMTRMEAAIREAMLVAKAQGIEIMDDPFSATKIVCSRTADNVSSMLQDIRAGKKTEIDAINGAVAELALPHNILTPENRALVNQIHNLEEKSGES